MSNVTRPRPLVILATAGLLLLGASSVLSLPVYDVVSIGSSFEGATNGTAHAVNENGDVAGHVAFQSAWEHTPFVFTAEQVPILLPRPSWAVTARALDLSNRHEDGTVDVVGWAANSIYSGDLAVAWRVSITDGSVLEMIELGTLPGLVQSQAKAINELGDLVGYSGGFMQFGGPATWFSPGGPEPMGNLYTAVAVNESRVVLAGRGWESVRYDLGTTIEDPLGRPEGSYNGAIGTDLNDLGQVTAKVLAADTDPRGQYISQAWRYRDGTGWEYLFGGGSSLDAAIAINNRGDVIGQIVVGLTYVDVLYLEETGAAYQVETLFAESFRNVDVGTLNDINDVGQIATSGPGGPVLLTSSAPTSIDDGTASETPDLAKSLTSYPNPFRSGTTLRYAVPATSTVSIDIYDSAGRLVRGLIRGESQGPGTHTVIWEALDDHRRRVPPGVYFYRIDVGSESATGRVTLLE